MKTRNMFKKIIIYTLVALILFNFIISSVNPSNFAYATSVPNNSASNTTQEDGTQVMETTANELMGKITNGVAGVLTLGLRAVIVGTASVFQIISTLLGKSVGTTNTSSVFISPLDIFFNNLKITDINIFSTEGLPEDGFVYKIRTGTAAWFQIANGIAIACMLIVLIIVGVKLVLANLAEEKARAKALLKDWIISLALIIFMDFIIICMIVLNNTFVDIIGNIVEISDVSNIMDALLKSCFDSNTLLAMGSTIVYAVLAFQTMIFLVIYILRFFVFVILVAIAPIIPIFYALGKYRDGKSLVLERFFSALKNIVFIQVVHCLISGITVGVILSMLVKENVMNGFETLALVALSVIAVMSISKIEGIIRSIFGFNDTVPSSGSAINKIKNTVHSAAQVGATALGGRATSSLLSTTAHTENSNQASGVTFGENLDNAKNEGNGIASGDLGFKTSKIQYSRTQASSVVVSTSSRNVQGSNEDEDAELNNPIKLTNLIPILDNNSLEENKIEDAVNSTKHEDESVDSENVLEESEIENADSKNVLEDDSLDENSNEMLENIESSIEEKIATIEQKLVEIEGKLDKGEAEAIINNINKSDEETGKEYANSLGDTLQGEYAQNYIKYLESKGSSENSIQDIEEMNSEERGEDIETNTELSIPQVAIKNALDASAMEGKGEDLLKDKTIRDVSIDNAKMLQALEGEVTVEGEFTDNNLTDFNIKILNKVSQGTYSSSNFELAQAKVQREGEEAVRRLEEFKNSQTANNASALTPGGKEYARLMIEAQQAGMIVSSVRTMTQEAISVEKTVEQSVSPKSNNVVDNLNRRKIDNGVK